MFNTKKGLECKSWCIEKYLRRYLRRYDIWLIDMHSVLCKRPIVIRLLKIVHERGSNRNKEAS